MYVTIAAARAIIATRPHVLLTARRIVTANVTMTAVTATTLV
jgi:hypothetical protein